MAAAVHREVKSPANFSSGERTAPWPQVCGFLHCESLVRALHTSQSQLVPQESSSKWEPCLVLSKPGGLAAAWAGGDAEHRSCPQQQPCFSTCPQPVITCTMLPIVVIALFPCMLRGPRILLPSLQGSLCYWAALGQGGCCRQMISVPCSVSHGARNIYFSQSWRLVCWLGFFFFLPLFNHKYKLFRNIAQAQTHDRSKITVKMKRKGGRKVKKKEKGEGKEREKEGKGKREVAEY